MNNLDVIIIGAGFAGLRALLTLRGLGLSAKVLESADDIGGVWLKNGYPGARCDVESYDYSYMFSPELEQEWNWSERYALQPEILRYIHHVAEKFSLRPDIELRARVVSAQYDEGSSRWQVATDDGRQWCCRYLITAVGQLSTTKSVDYPGQDLFRGPIYHSGEWPRHAVDLQGKRVGIIGTGSSGVQMTPVIAREAKHLTVFQRTANFSIPAANAPVSDEENREVKANYRARRERALNSPSGLGFVPNKQSALDVSAEEREMAYEAAYNRLGFGFALAYYDVLLSEKANETAADFVRRKIAEKVADPRIREKLIPRGFPFAARRPSVDSGYFEAFNRDNVTLADIREHPIREFTAKGIRTAEREHELDVIIFATGFDAFTGSLLKPRIVGRGGITLNQKWSAGPQTYLGLAVADFPNMFIIGGPGSPSLLSNVLLSNEQQVDWIAALLMHATAHEFREIEAKQQAESEWVAHVNARAQETLYPKAQSYYMGAEIEGKPKVFMPYSGGVRGYRRILENVVAKGYEGFMLRQSGASA